MKIALDIMGGDFAPFSNIEGAFSYIDETNDSTTQLLLVGDKPTIEKVSGSSVWIDRINEN